MTGKARGQAQTDPAGRGAESPAPSTDPAGYEDDEVWQQRQQLGLRPIRYPDGSLHPDSEPCPTWCWRAEIGESHRVSPRMPRLAWHTSTDIELQWAAQPGGEYAADSTSRGGVLTSTLDLRLSAWSGREPTINLRPYIAGKKEHEPGINLTLDDARELAVVLLHLLDQANGLEGSSA